MTESTAAELFDFHQASRHSLPMWTVYGPGTSDLPGRYVVRIFLTLPLPTPTRFYATAADLEGIYLLVPRLILTRLLRSAEDDANIIESWF